MPEKYDGARLEQIMREGLAANAEASSSQLDRPLPSVKRRARARAGWVAAAAAVLAVAGGVPLLQQISSGGDSVGGPAGGTDSWRVESYAGVQIKVPETWGWGGAPIGDDACGVTEAYVVPGSDKYEFVDRATPFVGRPAAMTDACALTYVDPSIPKVDAVWLGSALEVGTATHADGQVSETIAVGDQHVTVFSEEDRLREQILATARSFEVDGNGCPATPPSKAMPAPESLRPTFLSVCVYGAPGGEQVLLWSGRRGAEDAAAYVEAVDTSSALYDPATFCAPPAVGPYVALGVNGTVDGAPRTRWDVVNFECMQIGSAYFYGDNEVSASAAPLLEETIEPWAGGGTLAYVHLPPTYPVELKPYFRGPLG